MFYSTVQERKGRECYRQLTLNGCGNNLCHKGFHALYVYVRIFSFLEEGIQERIGFSSGQILNIIIYFNSVPLQLSDLSPSAHRIKEHYKRLTFPSHHLMDDHQHNNAILYSSVFSSSAQHRILPQGSLPPRA